MTAILVLANRGKVLAMRNIVRVRNLTLVSSFAMSACMGGLDDGGDLDVQLGAAEATLSSRICPDDTPPELAPPPDQTLAFVLDATGVQQYSCNATATGAAWTFVAPDAELFDHGRLVGTHYAGPTWEHEDGSTVVAALAAGATLDPTAIPWLLLSAVSHGGATGKMTEVTWIQRLETTGGIAPATCCDVGRLGATASVPYTAEYYFYRASARPPQANKRCGATRRHSP